MTLKELEQVTISALKAGSIDAFNFCFDLYWRPLCSFANSMVREPAVAEEIVQNLFLDLWINRHKLPENSSLKAYLLTAVRHDCLDHLKHKKIREKYEGEYLESHNFAYEDIFDDLINKDLERSLQAAISILPKQCREIFLLSRFQYLSYKEIAEHLNISPKTVENQIGKALKIVRQALDPFL